MPSFHLTQACKKAKRQSAIAEELKNSAKIKRLRIACANYEKHLYDDIILITEKLHKQARIKFDPELHGPAIILAYQQSCAANNTAFSFMANPVNLGEPKLQQLMKKYLAVAALKQDLAPSAQPNHNYCNFVKNFDSIVVKAKLTEHRSSALWLFVQTVLNILSIGYLAKCRHEFFAFTYESHGQVFNNTVRTIINTP